MFLQHHVGGAVGEGVGHLVRTEVSVTTAAADVVVTFALPLDDASPDAFLRCVEELTSIQARLHAPHVTCRFRMGGEVEHGFADAGSLVADRSGSRRTRHRVASPEALTGNMGEVAGRLSRHRNSGWDGHAADGVGAGKERGDEEDGCQGCHQCGCSTGPTVWRCGHMTFLLGPVAGRRGHSAGRRCAGSRSN
ncbi:MAG: hypothetical protein EBY47_09410 [Actinobacteria bacterium]|nr:hypothetical protein [Actinomycetota bacterium]